MCGRRCTPWVTWSLIVILSLFWLASAFLMNNVLIFKYGYKPGDFSFLTLFASMFLQIGLLHVAGNLRFLWMFAAEAESRLGSFSFLLAYLVSGLAGQGQHTLVSAGSLVPTVGAAGAISRAFRSFSQCSSCSVCFTRRCLMSQCWFSVRPSTANGFKGTWALFCAVILQ
jgi:membrane associated rhomboid family serine protease